MKSFEDLLKEEHIEYCVSGHSFDSGMTCEQLAQLYRERNLDEQKNVKFRGSLMTGDLEGSKFFIDDLLIIHIHPARERNIMRAKEAGVESLKSHAEIHIGDGFYAKDGMNVVQRELRYLLEKHVQQRIPGTCYFSTHKEFQGINKV